MTPRQIEIVRENYKRIVPNADQAATAFYNRLFTLDTNLRHLFHDDLTEQKHKLIMLLKFSVETLDRMDVFKPSLEALGRGHLGSGVCDEHYKTVGIALILTLREMFGAEFTKEIESAWIETYTLIAGTMRRAVRRTAIQAV